MFGEIEVQVNIHKILNLKYIEKFKDMIPDYCSSDEVQKGLG